MVTPSLNIKVQTAVSNLFALLTFSSKPKGRQGVEDPCELQFVSDIPYLTILNKMVLCGQSCENQ